MNRPCHAMRQARGGITIVELLIVCAIVSLLLAILLPAVQAVREASRQVACRNNLKQIALAMANYQTQHEYYPLGVGAGEFKAGVNVFDNFSVPTRLLAQLDQSPLFNQINFQAEVPADGRGGDASLLALCEQNPLAVLRCSSAGQLTGGNSSYVYNTGITLRLGRPSTLSGAFSAGRWLRPADFIDGLGHTAGISEILPGIGGDFDPRRHVAWVDHATIEDTKTAGNPANSLVQVCADQVPRPGDWYGGRGRWWIDATGSNYNHYLPPNSLVISCAARNTLAPAGPLAARSEHPGIVMTAFMDGAVRPISNSINMSIWHALATRAGGDLAE